MIFLILSGFTFDRSIKEYFSRVFFKNPIINFRPLDFQTLCNWCIITNSIPKVCDFSYITCIFNVRIGHWEVTCFQVRLFAWEQLKVVETRHGSVIMNTYDWVIEVRLRWPHESWVSTIKTTPSKITSWCELFMQNHLLFSAQWVLYWSTIILVSIYGTKRIDWMASHQVFIRNLVFLSRFINFELLFDIITNLLGLLGLLFLCWSWKWCILFFFWGARVSF